MTEDEWNKDFARCLGVFLSGDALQETDACGRRIVDSSFLLLFNAHHDIIPFRLLEPRPGAEWLVEIDTAFDNSAPQAGLLRGGTEYPLQGRSLALLRYIDAGA
jgi:glycogen operon protein